MTRTLPAKLALVLAWLITMSVTLIAPDAAAKAATPELAVQLTALTITGKGANQTAELTGTVTNVGVQPAFGVRPVLWRSRDPIREADAFPSVLSGENDPWGERLNRTPDHSFWITDPGVAFDPGAMATFTVRGTLADLGFVSAGAIYVFGVQVFGTPDGSLNFVELARARTFFVVPPKARLPLTSVMLLSATPTKVRSDVFANERLVGELTGRLDGMVELAAGPGVSWLVDPALIDEVKDMADGYTVLDGEGTRPGTGQQAAQAWLQRFRALPNAHGARTLFGNPDVLGAEQNNQPGVVGRAVAAMKVSELDQLPLLVLPYLGLAGPSTPAFVAAADEDAIVVGTAGRGRVVAKGPDGSTVLRLAPETTAAGPGAEDGPIQRQQRQYAEAVLGRGLLRVITTPEQAAADVAAAPSWMRRTSIDDLLGGKRKGPAATLTLPSRTITLPASRFRQLSGMTEDLDRYRDLVPDSALASDASATLSRMVSTWWIGDPTAGTWHSAVADPVSQSAVTNAVTVSASPRVLMSSRINEFPVTVSNELSEPIQVRIVFTSDNPQRISIPPTRVISVAPGQSQTVNVRPEASSNGLVNVTATLQTGSGRPVGQTTRIAVEVTDLGMIGWIIVIVSGTVLVAATALRIRQVRRKQKEEA